MNIEIGNNFVITSDRHNVILNEKITRKNGKNAGEVRLKTIGYYATLTGCLEGLVDYSVRMSKATTVEELMREIKDLKKMIKDKLRN